MGMWLALLAATVLLMFIAAAIVDFRDGKRGGKKKMLMPDFLRRLSNARMRSGPIYWGRGAGHTSTPREETDEPRRLD